MFAGFKYTIVVLVILTLLILLLPLLVFVWDVIQNPECIILKFENTSYINSEELKANIIVSYCSSIPLRNVKIQIGSRLVEFDYISKGVTCTEGIIFTTRDLEEGVKGLEASIGGFYRVVIKFK